MAQRVVATEEAVSSVQQLQTIVNGGLQSDVQKLKQLLQTLSDPNQWDGKRAIQFRTQEGPSASRALDAMIKELEDLRGNVGTIVQAILNAG